MIFSPPSGTPASPPCPAPRRPLPSPIPWGVCDEPPLFPRGAGPRRRGWSPSAGAVLYLVVGYEPDVYSRATAPSPEIRHLRSEEFLTRFFGLLNDAKGSDENWGVQFTDEQLNSYLDEGYAKQPFRLPDRVSRPHFVFEPGKAQLAFRYDGGAWSSIITIDLRIWLAREEPNAVALEVEGLRAGALPISAQWLQQQFGNIGKDAKRDTDGAMEVSWYRLNGHPVALMRFQSDQEHPTLLLQDVHVDQGSLTIRGRSPEAAMHAFLMRFPTDGLLKSISE